VRVASQYFQRESISWPTAHASSQRVCLVNVRTRNILAHANFGRLIDMCIHYHYRPLYLCCMVPENDVLCILRNRAVESVGIDCTVSVHFQQIQTIKLRG
jgi:hypothetical protein